MRTRFARGGLTHRCSTAKGSLESQYAASSGKVHGSRPEIPCRTQKRASRLEAEAL